MTGGDATNLPDIPPVERIQLSRRKIIGAEWRNRLFRDLNGLRTEFINCDFSYSIFDGAYLRDASFTNCVFIGCQFFDCNLRGAQFLQCDLKFTKLYNCLADVNEMLVALPFEPNIRREGLQNLIANANSTADFAGVRLLVLDEIKASKDHYWRALTGPDSYYRQKYSSAISKVWAGWKLLSIHIGSFIWGNGERPLNIVTSGLAFMSILTLINFWSVLSRVSWEEAVWGIKIAEYTTSLFLSLDVDKKFRGFVIVDYALAAMRYVYVGLYVAVLFRALSRR